MQGFHHVALTVRDLAASADWYQTVFGFETLFTEQSEQRLGVVMQVPATKLMIGLVQHLDGPDGRFDAQQIGLDHLAIDVGSPEEMESWAARLDELGIDHSGWITVPPGAILNFKDPDGIALALFWDREQAR